MAFPIIKNLSDILPYVENDREFNIKQDSLGNTVICYSILADNAKWFSKDRGAYLRECRGITFGHNGEIISRPFEKFFNFGETPENQKGNLSNLKVEHVFSKLDGSMVTPITDPKTGRIVLKTKKNVGSDTAKLATRRMHQSFPEVEEFCKVKMGEGKTPIFEFTAPDNQIVILYTETNFRLIGIRDNITGEYFDIYEESKAFPLIQVVDDRRHEILAGSKDWVSTIIDFCKDTKKHRGIEGFVVVLSDGRRVKFKTQWYIDLHHTCTFIRDRDVAQMVMNETIDDVISKYAQNIFSLDTENPQDKHAMVITKLRLEAIDRIWRQVQIIISELYGMFGDGCEYLRQIQERFGNDDRKQLFAEFIKEHGGNPFQKLIIRKVLHPENFNDDFLTKEVCKHFRREILPTFSLNALAAEEISAYNLANGFIENEVEDEIDPD